MTDNKINKEDIESYYKTYAINNNVKKFIAFNKLRWPNQKNSNNIIESFKKVN